ncbi:MAG: hypothetical protein IPN86_10335 [Saprospiraceae bacterium]|nr:hypothetical protein [Saprospiraceae bacterium]
MPIAEAKAAVTITLDDHDEPLQRGDLLVSEEGRPEISCEVKLLICWFDPNENLKIGARYHIIHHSNNFKCKVSEIDYVFDLNENTKQPTDSLKVNDIGLVTLKTELPTFIDKYDDYKSTGTVILVDPIYFNSVAVGWKI